MKNKNIFLAIGAFLQLALYSCSSTTNNPEASNPSKRLEGYYIAKSFLALEYPDEDEMKGVLIKHGEKEAQIFEIRTQACRPFGDDFTIVTPLTQEAFNSKYKIADKALLMGKDTLQLTQEAELKERFECKMDEIGKQLAKLSTKDKPSPINDKFAGLFQTMVSYEKIGTEYYFESGLAFKVNNNQLEGRSYGWNFQEWLLFSKSHKEYNHPLTSIESITTIGDTLCYTLKGKDYKGFLVGDTLNVIEKGLALTRNNCVRYLRRPESPALAEYQNLKDFLKKGNTDKPKQVAANKSNRKLQKFSVIKSLLINEQDEKSIERVLGKADAVYKAADGYTHIYYFACIDDVSGDTYHLDIFWNWQTGLVEIVKAVKPGENIWLNAAKYITSPR